MLEENLHIANQFMSNLKSEDGKPRKDFNGIPDEMRWITALFPADRGFNYFNSWFHRIYYNKCIHACMPINSNHVRKKNESFYVFTCNALLNCVYVL